VTIETPDGYTVTLTHLGTIVVAKGALVTEGQAVATIGPSGTPELDRPYVHLGIRTTSDADGYLDPLRLLPPPAEQSAPAQTVTQPGASGGSAVAPAEPAQAVVAASAPSVATTRGSTVSPEPTQVLPRERPRARQPRTESRPRRPASHDATTQPRAHLPQRHVPEQASRARRPVVEATAPSRPAGLDAGQEIQPGSPVVEPLIRPHGVAHPIPLVLNGAAAVVALAAALVARRRKSPLARAQILHLPRPAALRRAA
jgi:hypothetical protein